MAINGVGLGAAAVGAIFVYGGLMGKSPLKVAQAVIQGASPGSIPQTQGIGAGSTVTGGSATTAQESTGSNGLSAVSSSNNKNQQIGQMLAQPYGWNTGQEWSDLVSLWTRESGWNNTADTRVTHSGGDNAQSQVFAYGIAQARPATKYPLAGQPPDLGGTADPTAQIQWGLQYIKEVYGDPSTAWAHELSNNWY